MSFFVFTPKAELMLKNVSSFGPRLPIYDNSGPRLPICFTLGAGALPSNFTREAGALPSNFTRGAGALPSNFTRGAGALPSNFTRGAGALHAKISKTHPAAGGSHIYIPCLNIIVAGPLFSKKCKEPGQGPCGPRRAPAYFKPYTTDLERSASSC